MLFLSEKIIAYLIMEILIGITISIVLSKQIVPWRYHVKQEFLKEF